MSASLSPQERQGLMLAAALLRYPQQPLTELLASAGPDAMSRAATLHEGLGTAVERLSVMELETWQAEHVRVFDLASDTTPHLAWHLYGDTPDLGRAYAALLELYRDAGFEIEPGELPDSLPVVLEFAAVAPGWATDVLLDGFAPALCTLRTRLHATDSLYAPVLEAVNDLLGLDSETASPVNISVNASTVKECAL